LAAIAHRPTKPGHTDFVGASYGKSNQVQAGEPRSVIGKTVEKMDGLFGASGAGLVYADYPYNLFAPDAPKS
jgi:hypothetical protein